ncbi:MAG: hypothetical protein H0V56_12360 [Chthoniobacterales bacterium]|nr:hypothetical protein [Chthoniobacterales bacterium]
MNVSRIVQFRHLLAAFLCLAASAAPAHAQFSPALLQNHHYWGDGKAEFSIYGAQIVRYGEPRETEVLHILVREPFDPKQGVKPEDWKQPGMTAVLKMNQILHVPTGLYVYQQMHSNFWRVDDAKLAKFSLTSNDSCGNTYKEARRDGDKFTYEYRTYWDGMAAGSEPVTPAANGYFYDELPWLVRTIDFSKPEGEFEIQLSGSAIHSKKDNFEWQPAKVSFKAADDRFINVQVQHGAGADEFVLDRHGPHLLREWKQADGSRLKMKRMLKVDYWNHNKPGDKERAFKNPMLRLPD